MCVWNEGVFGCSSKTVIAMWSALSWRCKSSQLQSTYSRPTQRRSDRSQKVLPPAPAHLIWIYFNIALTMWHLCSNFPWQNNPVNFFFGQLIPSNLRGSSYESLSEPLASDRNRPHQKALSWCCDSFRWHLSASPAKIPTCSAPSFSVSLPLSI